MELRKHNKTRFVAPQTPVKLLRGSIAVALQALIIPTVVEASPWFEEVSEEAGITGRGATYGSAWGDVNGDGHADLWVGNHYSKPSLYINRGDGTFTNEIDTLWTGDPEADTHGAAWADFDNDGDQDLIELVGGGGGQGVGRNHLFVNVDGRLIDQAAPRGAEYPYGRGRTPLWFDIDQDGYLDLIFANAPRADAKGRTVALRQSEGLFQVEEQDWALRPKSFSKSEKLTRLIGNLVNARLRMPTRVYGNYYFAQIANLTGDEKPELMVYSPLQIFAPGEDGLAEVTDEIHLPRVSEVVDVAIADFDGDSKMDLYMVRPARHGSKVKKTSDRRFIARVVNSRRSKTEETVTFVTKGQPSFDVGPYFFWSPQQIKIGTSEAHPEQLEFSVTREAAAEEGDPAPLPSAEQKLHVFYKPEQERWTVRSTVRPVNLVVSSSAPIDVMDPPSSEAKQQPQRDSILLQREKSYDEESLTHPMAVGESCASVVSGDFDNDRDVDLYLVCMGVVENAKNLLYENLGDGSFRLVADSGVEGSSHGVGDSAVTVDFDGDGFLDIFVGNGAGAPPFFDDGPHQLFRNKGNENHWLQLDLIGTRSNRDGIGAYVEVHSGGSILVRQQDAGMHARSQNHMRLHFGLGEHERVERVRIYWPSGTLDDCENVAADRILAITEGSCGSG